MAATPAYNFDNLGNEAERLVREELARQLEGRGDLCTCQECVLDMAAYALNHLKPRYRVSLLGTFNDNDQVQYAGQVRKAVTEAVAKISANPAHD